MGCNYYLKKDFKPKREEFMLGQFEIDLCPWVHIGKDSCGLQFLFDGSYVELWQDWKEIIEQAIKDGWSVINECDQNIEKDHFFSIVEMTKLKEADGRGRFKDPDGWTFMKGEFI